MSELETKKKICRECGTISRVSIEGKNPYKNYKLRDTTSGRLWNGNYCPDCDVERVNDMQRNNLSGKYRHLRKTHKPKKDYD